MNPFPYRVALGIVGVLGVAYLVALWLLSGCAEARPDLPEPAFVDVRHGAGARWEGNPPPIMVDECGTLAIDAATATWEPCRPR